MKRFLLAVFTAVVLPLYAHAQGFDAVIDNIVESYTPWQSVEFSGRLKCDRLPLSPSVKMYMVRDSLLQISVRAPLLGEVGRLNVTRDEVLVVNKMRRVYCSEPAESLFELWPSMLSDLQSVFLARVAVLGSGELDAENSAVVDAGDDGEGNWIIVPQTDPGTLPFNYGYLVSPAGRTLAMMGSVTGKGSLTIEYSYPGRGEQLDITLDRSNGKKTEATLEFTSVKWGGTEMSPVRLGNYSKVGLKEFIGSISK